MKMITKEIEKLMDRYPLGSQDGKGDEAQVICKIFNPYGSMNWYVLEAGPVEEDGDRMLFVLTTNCGDREYGYEMLKNLLNVRVHFLGYAMPLERDRYFKGTVADALADAGVFD